MGIGDGEGIPTTAHIDGYFYAGHGWLRAVQDAESKRGHEEYTDCLYFGCG